MKKVLLLNPPGEKLYLRDSYCSKISKSGYLYHPVDLMVQWGIFKNYGWKIYFIDAIAEELSLKECIDNIVRMEPDMVVGLASYVSIEEDVIFYRKLRVVYNGKIFLGGDLFLDGGIRHFSEFPVIDGFFLDYTTTEMADNSFSNPSNIKTLLLRENLVSPTTCSGGERNFGIPEWSKIRSKNYIYPFALNLPLATMITSTGCPHSCDFCVSGTFPLSYRPVDEIIEEIELILDLGYKEIYFADQTFNFSKKRMISLLNELLRKNLKFTWSAFIRIENIDEEILNLLHRTGCHTLIAGIESGNYEMRKRYGKDINDNFFIEKIALIHSFKIRVVGTFILGLPGETLETAYDSLNFAIRSKIDFVSFNVAVPRPKTKIFYDEKWKKFHIADQSSGKLHFEDVSDMLKDNGLSKLIKKFNIKFYMRSSYIIRRLLSIKTFTQLKIEIIQGINLIFG